MQKLNMDHSTGHGSVYMTLLTVLLYFSARFTITDWAGIATILAALSTVGLNVYKFIKEKEKKKTP